MQKLLILFLCFSNTSGHSQQNSSIQEYQKSFTTYPFSDPNPIPAYTNIYPYFRFDGFTDKPIQKEWKVVEMENDFIKLTILPEVGGKIWSAIEKSTGKPFIYENHVIKFRDIAMRGPWTSGGIEANYGIMGHTPNCATPVDYITQKKVDGSVSCTIGALDLLTGTHWRIEINLPKDKAWFTTKSFWYNPTSLSQPYYHWMNAGFKVTGNLQFIYPGTHYLGHGGEYNAWPVNSQNGKEISFYDNNNFGGYKSYHVFGTYTHFFGGYWHDDNFGMVRFSDRDDKAGKKIWIWGLSPQGMIWEKLLTDKDGQYTEMQSGRLFNQTAEESTYTPFKHKDFAPYATDVWTEYWFPVLKTNGFVEANEYGALNTKYDNGWLKIYFSPVQKIEDTLKIKRAGKIVFNKKIQLEPLETYEDSVRIDENPANMLITLGKNKLVYNSQSGIYNLSRPMEAPKDFDWQSSYGLYLLGKELMDEKRYARAEEKLSASLKKDSNFLPALVKMSELLYRNMQYAKALKLTGRALSINTNDGAANYYYGLINAKLNNKYDAKDGFEIATLSMEFRSAAYTELSTLSMEENNWNQAIKFADQALAFNQYNIPALQNKAIAFRKLMDTLMVKQTLDLIISFDPLSHFARFENYLQDSSQKNKTLFTSLVRNEFTEETYLQLAVEYYNRGCLEDAERALMFAKSTEAAYWRAFLQYKMGTPFAAQLEIANAASPSFVFPFRSEGEMVWQWAIEQNDNWKPKYYLALLYQHKNRNEKCTELFNACSYKPGYAPFYAARAALPNSVSRLTDLKKAMELDEEEWRYHKLLTEYYLDKNENFEALKIVEPFYKSHAENYIMGMLYAQTLLLNNRYKDCSLILEKINILPFEGATIGHELYREALLLQAIEKMKLKNPEAAIQLILDAKKWPGNLGSGKPYDADIDERLEDWMLYLNYQEINEKKAKQYLQKIILFNPKTESTTAHSFSANQLIVVWAIEKKSSKSEALKWLDNQGKGYRENKIFSWVKNTFEKGKYQPTEIKDSNIRIIKNLLE